MNLMKLNGQELAVTKANIEKQIENRIQRVNEKYYKKLMNSLKNSEGEYIEKMRQQIILEYQIIVKLVGLYKKILNYMKEAADEMEELDRKYSNHNIQE